MDVAAMTSKLEAVFTNNFFRSVAVLAGGTAFAQGLPLLVMPLLTRLYGPGDFGVLAVFGALLGMLAVIAGLQYETAIPVPEADATGVNLVAVALVSATAVSAATALVVGLFSARIAAAVSLPGLAPVLWLLPIGVAATVAYTAWQYWAVRKKAFRRIARTRLLQAVSAAGVQLGAGLAGAGAVGLVSGLVVNNGMGSLGLARSAFRESREALRSVSWQGMRRAAAEFRRFPQYTAIESLANAAAIQVPVLLIAYLAPSHEVGFLALAMRVIQAPMSLVGIAVSQVFYADAVTEHREGRLAGFTVRVIEKLAMVGVGPLICAGIVAPSVFVPIFGDAWGRAGALVAWMTPWFALQFLVSPVSMVLYVTSRQATAMALQTSGLVLRAGAVLLASRFVAGQPVSEAYALSGFVFYFAYLVVVVRAARMTRPQVLDAARRAAPFVAVWTLAGLVVTWIL
jgi:O-antigen/teichoic acid export membrane protein